MVIPTEPISDNAGTNDANTRGFNSQYLPFFQIFYPLFLKAPIDFSSQNNAIETVFGKSGKKLDIEN